MRLDSVELEAERSWGLSSVARGGDKGRRFPSPSSARDKGHTGYPSKVETREAVVALITTLLSEESGKRPRRSASVSSQGCRGEGGEQPAARQHSLDISSQMCFRLNHSVSPWARPLPILLRGKHGKAGQSGGAPSRACRKRRGTHPSADKAI